MEERHAHLKRHLAHPVFAVATVDTWLRHYDRDTRISVEVPRRDGRAPDRASGPYVVVSNCDPYTYVGRRRVTISPDASLDRSLAVATFSSLAPALLVRAAASGLLHARDVATNPAIAQLADVDELTVSCDRPTPWQVDGDHLGSITALRVRYVPDALRLLVPESPRARGRARR
jgi:diacylglycerol kinase family enzyme